MVHVGAAETDGPGVFHHQRALAERPACRAREVVHRRDHHQLRRTALALCQPRPLAVGQLGRDPVRSVCPLDLGIAGLGEPQRPPVAGARNIRRLARLQAPLLVPTPESSALRSRFSPGSRSPPARDSPPGPAATRQPSPAAASPRRPARRSRSRTSARRVPPPPPAPHAAPVSSDSRRSRRRKLPAASQPRPRRDRDPPSARRGRDLYPPSASRDRLREAPTPLMVLLLFVVLFVVATRQLVADRDGTKKAPD
jgi:hypothetical protein